MNRTDFLDSKNELGAESKTLLMKAEAALWAGDYGGAVGACGSLLKDGGIAAGFAFLIVGDAHHFTWEQAKSLTAYRRALVAFNKLSHEDGSLFAKYRISDTHLDALLVKNADSAQWAESKADFEAAFERAKQLDAKFLVAFGHHYSGLFAFALGDSLGAKDHLESAISLREQINDEYHLLSSRALLASVLGSMGQFDAAIALAESTYKRQVALDLKGPAYRTLLALRNISSQRSLEDTSKLAFSFTKIGPNFPFLGNVEKLNEKFVKPTIMMAAGGAQVLHS